MKILTMRLEVIKDNRRFVNEITIPMEKIEQQYHENQRSISYIVSDYYLKLDEQIKETVSKSSNPLPDWEENEL